MNPLPTDSMPSRSPESSEILILSTSVSLRDLLSYQDVMHTIEREFHLHEGQEREIIMKLWLKGQTMISILQRYRFLLQDLNLDDQDFLGGLKNIRDMINYAARDVHNLREHTAMLENQNRFLESEFQRQIDRIVEEKNDHIARLTHIIDQTCSSATESNEPRFNHSSSNEELLKKFMQQNVELQREIETLRVKLEYSFTFVNEKLDQQKTTGSSTTVLQTALEKIQESEAKLHELQRKSSLQREENELLKYLVEKSRQTSNTEQTQLLRTLEQRSLEREIDRIRHELELTEKKIADLKQRFDTADESVQFKLELFKMTCDDLRQHTVTYHQRLNEISQQTLAESQMKKNQEENEKSTVLQLQNELLQSRERCSELLDSSNSMKNELNDARNQLREREVQTTAQMKTKLKHEHELEKEFKSLQNKYKDVCERLNTETVQLERLQEQLKQSARRCERLEKEKAEIHKQSDDLSQNVTNITGRYKEKLHSSKSRLEQSDRQRRDAQVRSEHLQNEVVRLQEELSAKQEVIFEKEKLIQEAQYNNREILLEQKSIEDRRSNELTLKNRLLEEELERLRRNQMQDSSPVRKTEIIHVESTSHETASRLEEFRSRSNDFEQRYLEEKANRESLQVHMKILEEENIDLRDIMTQMRRRTQDPQKSERDRNDEIQQLIARAEFHARQYMTNFNLTSFSSVSTLARIIPLSSSAKISF